MGISAVRFAGQPNDRARYLAVQIAYSLWGQYMDLSDNQALIGTEAFETFLTDAGWDIDEVEESLVELTKVLYSYLEELHEGSELGSLSTDEAEIVRLAIDFFEKYAEVARDPHLQTLPHLSGWDGFKKIVEAIVYSAEED
jgi:hypothetical protein